MAKKRKPLTSSKPATSGYDTIPQHFFRRPRDLPPFTFLTVQAMLCDPTIRLGLAMRAAPLCNAEIAYKQGDEWTAGIQAEDEIIGAFVARQIERIFKQLSDIMLAQTWGWSAMEVLYRLSPRSKPDAGGRQQRRLVEVDRLLPRHPNDTRALVEDGEVKGVRFLRIKDQNVPGGHVDLPISQDGNRGSKALFHAHAPEPGAVYGNSIMLGAYSPWADKWLNGGALDVRRLFMQKDAYRGARIWYPNENYEITGKGTVPARDIARESVEQIKTGGVLTFPSQTDEKGNQRWVYEEAAVSSNPAHILQYPKDLDVEMLRGMEITDNIFMGQEGETGAWNGRMIPMQGFYTGLDIELTRLLNSIKRCILDYLVCINFGPGRWYEVDHKPLGEQAMEQQQKNQPEPPIRQSFGFDRDGDGDADQPPQRMSLEAAIGEGALDAAELVKGVRRAIAVRMAADAAGHEHKAKGKGGGQFTGNGKGGTDQLPAQQHKPKTAAAASGPASTMIQQARGIVRKIKPTKHRAFTGAPSGGKISKQLAGAIGEEIIIQWLKSQGFADAGQLSGFLGTDKNNLPVDLIHDHRIIEVKTGQASNGESAQQWRLTIGEPGEKEKAWLATASPAKKAAWNAKKQALIHQRKKKELATLEKHLGYEVQGNTMTVILNPDTKTADLYAFDGFHDRIAWKTEMAASGYLGSVTYA